MMKNIEKTSQIFGIFGNLATFFAVVSAVVSVIFSVNGLKAQLIAQEKATSVQIVSDFLNEVSHDILNKQDGSDFDQLLLTRTQLLLDTSKFPELTSQIVKFLGTNGYSNLFDAHIGLERLMSGAPVSFIELNGLEFQNGNIGDIEIKNAVIRCSDFNKATLTNAKLHGATIRSSNFNDAFLFRSELRDAKIEWSNFSGAYLDGADFKGSVIALSNLTNIRTLNDVNDRAAEVNALVNILVKAKSLYGSVLDKDVLVALKEKINESNAEGFKQLYEDISVVVPKNTDQSHSVQNRFASEKDNIDRSGWKKANAANTNKSCKKI